MIKSVRTSASMSTDMKIDPVYCKVTVRPAIKSPPPLMRRQTVGDTDLSSIRNQPYKRAAPVYKGYVEPLYNGLDDLQEDDTADIAVLCEEEPTWSARRRAYTTSSMSTSARLSSILNPLSRMTMRWTESLNDAGSSKATDSCTNSASSTPDLIDTPLSVLTPPPIINLANSFLEVDTDGSDEITCSTFEEVARLMNGTPPIPSESNFDMLPVENETLPISSHVSDVLQNNPKYITHISPLVDDQEGGTDDGDASYAATVEYDEEPTNYSVDIGSILSIQDQSLGISGSSLHTINSRKPGFLNPKTSKKASGLTRNFRGLSSPLRLLTQVICPRKVAVPDVVQATDMSATMAAHLRDSETPSVPMYHGLELHLAFTTGTGQITQVQGHPKRSGRHKNPFSRRIRCHAVLPNSTLDDGDTLQIIGHNTDGLLYGGDCVSFARSDGTVLRLQRLSKKLTFSNKIDVRAMFIITGVPDQTPVTSTSKFHLQSAYDRKRFVGYLPSRRDKNPGCLAMYEYSNAASKVEPTLFSKRHPGHSPVFWYHPQP